MIKKIALFLLRLSGWTVNTNVPKEAQRCIMIAAPHTTNWDFYYTRLTFFALDIPMKVTIKDDWTKFPFGLIIKPLGGLGIDRSPKQPGQPRRSYTEVMVELLQSHERIAMVITPEGSRSLRTEWKTGFYHTAKQAGVPITFGYLDYKKKEAGVGGAIHPSDDFEGDMKKVMDFYSNINPKFPEKFSLDQRFM